ncbi:alpha/beta hydrolase [Heyndrickxia acidicola]|uniref:Lysophospholipase n=1 Tax=Heyndrickxia acidicola TaxID=209389 RepID=A0ABU6MBA4_9BACI|nr:alpha/beta hydrolase [Heyndrickxia acidicola]MED1201916.1 lysophospholipase [Heyndrickxia acidicola]
MRSSTFWLKMSDNYDVYVKKWMYKEEETPRAIIQVSHGMAEHIERYGGVAEYLTSKGLIVYGNDHRGHGKTGEKAGVFGHFADNEGFERAVLDLKEITEYIKCEFPNIPIFLFGHSMGSFLARSYVQKYGQEMFGVILSGTGGNPGMAGRLGKLIALMEMKRKGPKASSPFLDKLVFGSYNKGIHQVKTKYDWLSRDQSEVEKYINDLYCGQICTSGFFYDLLSGLEAIHKEEYIRNIPKDLPFYFLSGSNDPVGGKTKGVLKVIKQFQNNGVKNIEYTFFPEGRHEMLNETNKEEVYQSILTWILKQLNRKKIE